jgi:hypothetical protein
VRELKEELARLAGKSREWKKKNPEGRAAIAKRYYESNKPSLLAKGKAYRQKYPERFRVWTAKHRAANKERCLLLSRINKRSPKGQAASRARESRNYRERPLFRIKKILRARANAALMGRAKKSARTEQLVGCSPEEFKEHIEKQLLPGWTWENYGTAWEIDHIKPCASFNMADPAQQRACFHFSNTQPLSFQDDRRKGAR